MNFSFTAEQDQLRDLCRQFATKEIAPHAHQWSQDARFPAETFLRFGELGLGGMLVPGEQGGCDAGVVSYAIAMEELGQADQSFAAAWNAHSTIASLPLRDLGTPEQKERWLRPLAEGRKLGAFALTEPNAGSDAAGVQTRAVRRPGGWVIDGTKMFISNAGTEISLGVTVLTRTSDATDRPAFSAFFVPDGTAGYRKGPPLQKLGWHAMDTRELVFDDCFVPDHHLLGEEGQGLGYFLRTLDVGRVSVAALAVSLAAAVLDLAGAHVGARVQFGRTLSSFQAVQHTLADMATELEAARWLVYRAAWLADAGSPFRKEAAMAKLFASEVANRAASAAVQLHGGYGFMRESTVARFYADAKVLEIGEGANEIQRDVIARQLGC